MPLRDGFFSTATQTSCCNRIQRSNRVRLLVVSAHDFPDNGRRRGTREESRNKHQIQPEYGDEQTVCMYVWSSHIAEYGSTG